ncbi:MAG: hypothetical protein M0D55_19370 [Elusimicrobiota bacterium]|nr:MAG: hypothetical protein M0D55_19370 [Elusimicrobiota bacterium]
MRSLLLALLLLPLSARAEDEATRLKLVQYMLKTPTADADPKLVAPFMEIDTETLPKNLREKAKSKQVEIQLLMKVAKGKKKGPFRFVEPGCAAKRYGPEGIRIMGMIIGNQEVEAEEVDYIKLKTNCTEDELLCEFSLNIVITPRKDKPPLIKYFLMETDPLMALVAEKRGGGGSAGNNYFQELKPSCQQSYK